jgi:hypothetical protein
MLPALARVGLMFNPDTYAFYDTYLEKFHAEAKWPMQMIRAAVRTPEDIDAVIADIAAQPDGGTVVLPDAFNAANRGSAHLRTPQMQGRTTPPSTALSRQMGADTGRNTFDHQKPNKIGL